MPQNIQWIRIKVCRQKKFASTSVALVSQFVGFSCCVRYRTDEVEVNWRDNEFDNSSDTDEAEEPDETD